MPALDHEFVCLLKFPIAISYASFLYYAGNFSYYAGIKLL